MRLSEDRHSRLPQSSLNNPAIQAASNIQMCSGLSAQAACQQLPEQPARGPPIAMALMPAVM